MPVNAREYAPLRDFLCGSAPFDSKNIYHPRRKQLAAPLPIAYGARSYFIECNKAMIATPHDLFDRLPVDTELVSTPFTFSEEDIIRFCREYDQQYFHTDPEAAKDSFFGGLVASGWQTAAMAINLMTNEHFNMPKGIIGFGLNSLRWLAPVYPDDQLTVTSTITNKRLSDSKPNTGIASATLIVHNQSDKAVLSMDVSVMIPLA